MTTDRRDDLARGCDEEYGRLKDLVARLRDEGRLEAAFATPARDRSVRDVLAHLYAWHLLLEGWYEEGMIGGSPALPAEGYTWRQLDALNVELRHRWADASVDDLERRLESSHAGLRRLVLAHSDDELFDRGAYPWTRGTALGDLCLECGSKHYAWARRTILAGIGEQAAP